MKTILITGSSRSIGKAIATLAHQKGYQVIIHGKTDSKQLRNLHAELTDSIKVFFNIANKGRYKVISTNNFKSKLLAK